jgi:hypothetical protein
MMAPSDALHAPLRPVIGAQWINVGLCVSLLSVAFALRHTLYCKDNYPRLQQVKARWDPRNVFHHALAIEPPA